MCVYVCVCVCVCVCVFLGSICLKLLLRDDFERFISCLDHWLCCMFNCIHVSIFLFWKNYFKNLLNTSSTPGYLSSFQAFSYCNLNTSSTPSGSIEKVLVSSITSWHLHLSMAIFSTPTLTDCSTPLDTFICQDWLMAYIFSSCFLTWYVSNPSFSCISFSKT